MIIIKIDPISGKEVENLTDAPYLLEGEGERTVKTYFESLENLADHADVEFIDPEAALAFFSSSHDQLSGGATAHS